MKILGDGKLGGIVTPNDGHCHMDEKGVYTHSSLQDYPSVSQINHKVGTTNGRITLLLIYPRFVWEHTVLCNK